jgi:hypothetical protein
MLKKSTPSKLQLLNPKSFFDTCISCPSAFELDIVNSMEFGSKSNNPNPPHVLQYVTKLLLGPNPVKPSEAGKALGLYRTTLFYLILMMDYCNGDMELLMMIQLLALQINNMYCKEIDTIAKTDPGLLRKELDKCTTFQNSTNCVTPNILKENFLEMVKTKEVRAYIKAKFVDVDFQEDLESEEIEEMEAGFAEQDKRMQSFFEQLERGMVEPKKKPRK